MTELLFKKRPGLQVLLACSLASLLMLSACVLSTPTPVSFTGCIPPPVRVAFPPYATREHGFSPTPVPMPSELEPQLSNEQMETFRLYGARSIVARSSDDIWITTTVGEMKLTRFRPSARELITYTVKVGEGEFAPHTLFLSKDGTLWGLGGDNQGRFQGFLSRYDEKTDRFVPVLDENCILVETHTGLQKADEDSQGILWITNDDTLVRYDPMTNQAECVLTRDQGLIFTYLAIAPDDAVWLSARQVDEAPGYYRMIRYDPRTGEIENYGSPPGAPPGLDHPIYFDRSGRLWAGDFGWLEFSSTEQQTWYQIVRPPIFISDRVEGELQYQLQRSYHVNESSDGLFWFSSGAGLARLDLENGEWCLMTTLLSQVAEDDKHNLWIAGDGQIYKYRLRP